MAQSAMGKCEELKNEIMEFKLKAPEIVLEDFKKFLKNEILLNEILDAEELQLDVDNLEDELDKMDKKLGDLKLEHKETIEKLNEQIEELQAEFNVVG